MIELPYPPSILNPNTRAHWRKKHAAAKEYKQSCLLLLAAQKPWPTIKFAMQFFPPDKRRRDRDNTIAAAKYLQDAIGEYWGIDDSEFEITYLPFGEPVKGGKVVICVD